MRSMDYYIRTADGVELRVRIEGVGEPTLLVPLSCWLADDIGGILKQGSIVSYDPRGRGGSSALHDDMDIGLNPDLADLEAVRQALGLRRFSLAGWSYYGSLAAHYASANPHRITRLVMIAPTPVTRDPYMMEATERAAERIDWRAVDRLRCWEKQGIPEESRIEYCRAFYQAYLASAQMAEPLAFNRMKSRPETWRNEWPAAFGELLFHRLPDALGAWDWRAVADKLRVATLVIHGNRDPFPVQGSAGWANSADAHLEVLDGTGHYPWLEKPVDFFRVVSEFLV